MSTEPELAPPPSSCPVNQQKWSMFGGGGGPPQQEATTTTVPQSVEEAARHAQTPQPHQRVPMSTERQVSSIPRSGSDDAAAAADVVVVPAHQSQTNRPDRWVYPSEQQIYNAMIRKGHTNIPEESIATVLQIHNGINENTWRTIVQDWENGDPCRLERFLGRPRDLSPKAFLLTTILQKYDPPFDRHDWYVANQRTGTVQRYVIDYYSLRTKSTSSAANDDSAAGVVPYVDVRPAVDHPYGVYLRTRRFFQLAFPGITAFCKQYWQER
jgi:cytochrome c heme-lyase